MKTKTKVFLVIGILIILAMVIYLTFPVETMTIVEIPAKTLP